MGLYIDNYRLVLIEPKTFHFDLPRDIGMNLKHEINLITVFSTGGCKKNHCDKNNMLMWKISLGSFFTLP